MWDCRPVLRAGLIGLPHQRSPPSQALATSPTVNTLKVFALRTTTMVISVASSQSLSAHGRAAIKAAAKELLPDAVELLKDIVDIDTSNPPGLNYPEIASVLDRFLSSKGYEVEQVTVPAELHAELVPFSDLPRVNVFAKLKPSAGTPDNGRVIHFNGHVVSDGLRNG
jgi:hypothetical protein